MCYDTFTTKKSNSLQSMQKLKEKQQKEFTVTELYPVSCKNL